MRWEMWSVWHILYIVSPIVLIFTLWLALRKAPYKVRYAIGVVIGLVSLGILIMRNVDIYLNNGFDPEIIPLQVCHFGNIMVFIALVFRSKIATSIAWTLNLISAFSSLIFADALLGYSDIMCIRAQAYIWGHLAIVLGSLYAVILKVVKIDFKSFCWGIMVTFILCVSAIVLNSYFNDVLGLSANYFYLYNSKGVPFEFLYIGERAVYGWFTINWIYTFSVMSIFMIIFAVFYWLQKLLYLKDKDYQTYHIFSKKKTMRR